MEGLTELVAASLAGPWLAEGLCVGSDAERWIAPGDTATSRELKAICQACPLGPSDPEKRCLEYALSLPERETMGVWGGTSERERRKIRMYRNRRAREEADGTQRAAG